ncbi:ABC transporter substrate-binding protein [Haladaptatus sp. DYSN1]|uniref:ABC transporter substrate-binding protein n=1 Tax=unclassified Haladaptatus TaxID=2622732 RepID=UPI00240579D9|nr:ABC transporter substrate-binding protein [Haladaptatus sp. DYSN1]
MAHERTLRTSDDAISRRRLLRLTAATGLAGAVAGCTSTDDSGNTTGTGTGDGGDSVMDNKLTMASNPNMPFEKNSWGMNGYNPQRKGGEISAIAIDRYMQFNPQTGEFLPRIAEEFSVADGILTVTMSDSYGWASGDPITAHDFATHYKILKGMEYGVGELFDSIEATDDRTVEISLTAPDTSRNILGMEFLISAASTPESLYGDYAKRFDEASSEDETKAIQKELQELTINPWDSSMEDLHAKTSGPFKMSEFNNQFVLMEPNEHYPNADNLNYSLEYQIVRDANALMSLLKADKLDAEVWAMSNEFLEGLPDHHDAWITPKFGGNAIMFMMNDDVYGNRDVRMALNYILDQQQMAKASNFVATPVTHFTGMPDSVTESYIPADTLDKFSTYEPDTEKATQHLENAGFSVEDDSVYMPNGDEWNLVLPVDSNSQDRIKESTIAVQQLNDFGINAEMKVSDASTYWKRYREGDWTIASWAFGERWNPLPYYDYKFLYSGETSGPAWNRLSEVEVQAPYPIGDPNGDLQTVDYREKISALQKASGDKEAELITELGWVFNQNMFVIPVSHETRQQVVTSDAWNYPNKDEYNGTRYGVMTREMIREGKLQAKSK